MMDFREICDFFGGTVFYDDLRGDLTDIRRKLSSLYSESPLPSINNTAKLILLEAVWNLLTGDFNNAAILLHSLTDDGIYGPRWCFRGHAYTGLMITWIEFPPLFKQCDLSGPSLLTWRKRSPAIRAALEFVYCHDHKQDATVMDILEFRVFYEINKFYSRTKLSAFKLNPTVEGYEDHQNVRDDLLKEVSASQSQRLQLLQRALDLGLVAVSAYLTRLMYEAAHSMGISASHLLLESLRERYTVSGDEVGIGLYWLVRGDHNASPSFTSPLVLNFDIADCPDDYGGVSTMFQQLQANVYVTQHTDQQTIPSSVKVAEQNTSSITNPRHGSSFTTPLEESEESSSPSRPDLRSTSEREFVNMLCTARDCYGQAEAHFKNAQSARGLAAVALRKACTLIMEDIQPYRSWKTSKHHSNIQELLTRSQELSRLSGDIQLQKLIQTHSLLVEMTNPISGRALGRWAESSQNDLFGLCLALLTFRVAQYFRYHCGSMTMAIKSLEVSRQIVKSMTGFRTLWFQIKLAEASISKSQGNLPWAKIWHGHLKDIWPQLFSQLVSSEPDPSSELDIQGSATFDIFIMRTMESIISVDINLGDPSTFPPKSTQDLLNLIEVRRYQPPITQQWLSTQKLHIKYQKTIRKHKRCLQRGELKEASLSLKVFLEDQDVRSRYDLQARSYIIDIAVLLGDEVLAREVLSRIHDHDLLPQLYMTIGRGFSTDEIREEKRRSLRSLEVILLCSIKAGVWARASHLLQLLETASPGFFTSKTSYTQLWPWQRCLYAGLVHEKEQQYNLAMLYFLQSWAFIKVSQMSIGTQDERRLLWDSPDVVRLVAALARRSLMWEANQPGVTKLEPTTDTRIDTRIFNIFAMGVDYGDIKHFNEALMFLESGRAQHVWETSFNNGGVPYEVIEANYKYRMWIQLNIKDLRTDKEEEEFQRLDKEKDEFSALLYSSAFEENSQPDLSNPRWNVFPFTVPELLESIPSNAIVIYPTFSDEGMMLLAIDRTGIKVGGFAAEVTTKVLRTGVLAYLNELQTGKGRVDSDPSGLDLFGMILSRVISNEPVERCIAAREHVIFVPSGDFMRVPLGALKYKNDYLILQKQVSQVPSLSALRHLRRNRQESSNSSVSVIAQPGSIARAKATGERALPMAGIEAKLVAMLAGTKVSNAKDVTRKQFQEDLQKSQFLHICTHGYSDADFAMNSYISLQDQFRVIDMLAVRTQVQLVTFSACLSGMGHASESGDMQGFSYAILAAGANAYIGALWNANDVATMIHMWYFYQTLFAALENPSLALAWQFATRLLYELTVPKAIKLLESFVLLWDHWEERGEKPNDLVLNGRKKLTVLIRDLKTENGSKMIDFKHPYIWAPFVMVGNASTIVQSSRHSEMLRKIQEMNIKKN
ncbi:CHAT domain-containing protein [Hyaloscypha finlandica]|nr:CHAT domain-containing protein [Hyaloscypha finlandica]